ncbi:MAG: urease accessory protein UreE [Roseinatronobacter sp.]
MTDLPPVRRLLKSRPDRCDGAVILDYDSRLIRRKRLQTAEGRGFLVDLAEVTNLDAWWGFELEDGSVLEIVPADEALTEVTGDLPRLAWHIGNRHTPCQIESARLLIRHDHVIEAMLNQLGATLRHITGPFTPEGGAYGHGRTMGHDHGPAPHHHEEHSHTSHTH